MGIIDHLVRIATPAARVVHRRRARRIEQAIPKVPLQQRHIDGCELLLDRSVLLEKLSCGAVCAEIGVDEGGFTSNILSVTRPRHLHLIDMWATSDYNESKFEAVRRKFAAEQAAGAVTIHRRSSLDAVGEFSDGYFDWVYIDTTHAYALTADELRAFAPKVKPGGLIAGHDYTMGNWSIALRFGVIEAVHEFCVEHDWALKYLTVDPIENQSFAIRRIADGPARTD
jgi:hypothetical protein